MCAQVIDACVPQWHVIAETADDSLSLEILKAIARIADRSTLWFVVFVRSLFCILSFLCRFSF
jgi:hypothetical protein